MAKLEPWARFEVWSKWSDEPVPWRIGRYATERSAKRQVTKYQRSAERNNLRVTYSYKQSDQWVDE